MNKTISHNLNNRISKAVHPDIRREQVEFWSQKSCDHDVNTLRIIVEQYTEWNSLLYIGFIDFDKAFDALTPEAIWEINNNADPIDLY